VNEDNIHTMHHNSKVVNYVLKDLQGAAKKAGLIGPEVVAGVVVTDEEWTPESVRTPPLRTHLAVETVLNWS
jgi:long-chain acyl-CoA synthetase